MAESGPQIAKQLISHDVLSAVVSLMKAPVQVCACATRSFVVRYHGQA